MHGAFMRYYFQLYYSSHETLSDMPIPDKCGIAPTKAPLAIYR